MKRRDFLQTSVLGAGALAVLGTEACAAGENPDAGSNVREFPAQIVALSSRLAEAPPPISEEERLARRQKAQRLMAESRIDALFIEPGASLMYFADLRWGRSERTFGFLLPREGDGFVICPAFERGRAEKVVGGRFEIRTWEEDESPFELIATALRDRGYATGTLALEESTRQFVAQGIATAAPALRLVSGDPVTHRCRGVKTRHEIEIMRFANRITVEAIRAATDSLKPGMTQVDLARNVREAMSRVGGSGGWVLALIGESSAYPHGSENPAPLREGDVVLIDAGLSIHGYQSDITRTVTFGRPSREVQEVFEIVREAQARALEATMPGRTCGEIDAVARRVAEEAGYGPGYRYFTHRLGHGIGLEGHEWPYLVRGSEVVLEPGMSFSNEPGIYQYGKFGVRLEDIMVVTDEGAELLTDPATVLA